MIADTRLEVELPGGAATLYAYRVSAVGASNIESERSKAVAFFAVPHRNQPGQPRLLLRKAKGAIRIMAIPGAGATPAGFRVHRVRSAALLDEVGLKRPPKIEHNDPRWEKIVPDDHTNEARHALALVQARADGVTESWCSHYYRIAAAFSAFMDAHKVLQKRGLKDAFIPNPQVAKIANFNPSSWPGSRTRPLCVWQITRKASLTPASVWRDSPR